MYEEIKITSFLTNIIFVCAMKIAFFILLKYLKCFFFSFRQKFALNPKAIYNRHRFNNLYLRDSSWQWICLLLNVKVNIIFFFFFFFFFSLQFSIILFQQSLIAIVSEQFIFGPILVFIYVYNFLFHFYFNNLTNLCDYVNIFSSPYFHQDIHTCMNIYMYLEENCLQSTVWTIFYSRTKIVYQKMGVHMSR
ncbi:hypothetical protein PV327_010547 [Microctonus hyperodae]|uniref:Transmembrane protein n=1 Tax=Microctonus hyperodae TaxID=165561 RepID=A0AA39KV20_MICHY|nr:hypothetical protein PV327_010547 [Microctonus hyperodae]